MIVFLIFGRKRNILLTGSLLSPYIITKILHMIKDRHMKLLELLPKHKFKVAPAAIEAGFSEQTAYKQAKSLLQTALKKQEKALMEKNRELANNKDLKASEITSALKQSLVERIGMTSEELFNQLKSIALNERDYASALKVLKPLARDVGVDLGEDESQKVTVPVLNVTVKERTSAQPSRIIESTTSSGAQHTLYDTKSGPEDEADRGA